MRYAIGFLQVQEGQKHDRWLFETDCAETAQFWLNMDFLVWDMSKARQVHTELDIY